MSTLEKIGPAIAREGVITLQEAAEFIWREAELLDRQEYQEWLSLWLDEGLYIVPIERDQGDNAAKLNVLYDDAEMRKARVKRLKSGFSISSAPSARTVRTTSRFVLSAGDEASVEVRCAQHIVEYKFERTRVLAGDATYRLVRRAGELKMERKEVLLINSDDALWGVGYLI
ncbi:hypothetical protein GRI75_10335 [Altererythrobacter soli]|uniref:Aromatic-ring-hydroxylating dioxygenase n=1 Tax=Croceibacterium soli TaxID=1739690 RepID=A0A6I4UXG6_9SPHN|nr:aromatic-ring-hydroxylating dioxygenase subunit beta [Croceibacterium soli]MXP42037.1 hypothetical protein [Croceibacterium soli]